MTDPQEPPTDALVEELAGAICHAASKKWRTNDEQKCAAVGFHDYDFDAQNNIWRWYVRAILPTITRLTAEAHAAGRAEERAEVVAKLQSILDLELNT